MVRTFSQLQSVGTVYSIDDKEATIRIFDEFCAGLRSVSDFSHLIVLYWAHMRDNKNDRSTLLVFPRRHAVSVEKGVFACRSPSRPNPIGLCVVELVKVEDCNLIVRGLDAFQGSPIVDIKPYLPRADLISDARVPEWTLRGPKT